MNNKRKGLLWAMAILLLTYGSFIMKNYILTPTGGFKWGTPFDAILLLPAIPFWPLLNKLPTEPTWIESFVTFGISSIFWLLVGYGIGYWMDKKQNKK
ncbi:MAG: hypothetical protein AABW88_05160 [Nanoarchaeota archaeon]